jgi:trk system potassium uptake protein
MNHKRQFLIIGAGRFGQALATTLHRGGHEVVVVDKSEAAIEAVSPYITHALIADATDEEVLRRLGASNFDTVIVAIGDDFEASVLATAAAKGVGVKHLISKASTEMGARILGRVGADEVLQPERDMGMRLGMQLSTPSIVDAFKLGNRHGVVELQAQEPLVGTLAHLRLPNRFGVQVIAVNRDGVVEINPKADFEIKPGDMLVVLGENDAIGKLRAYLS